MKYAIGVTFSNGVQMVVSQAGDTFALVRLDRNLAKNAVYFDTIKLAEEYMDKIMAQPLAQEMLGGTKIAILGCTVVN